MGKDIKHIINESLNKSVENLLRKQYYQKFKDIYGPHVTEHSMEWFNDNFYPIDKIYQQQDPFTHNIKTFIKSTKRGNTNYVIGSFPVINHIYNLIGDKESTVYYINKFFDEINDYWGGMTTLHGIDKQNKFYEFLGSV